MRIARTSSVAVSEFWLPPNFVVPKHDHGPPHIAIVFDGAMRDRLPTGAEDFTPGWMRYSPAGESHEVESLGEGTQVVVLEAFGFPQLQLNQRVRVGPDRAGPLIDDLRDQLFMSPFGSPATVEASALALFTMMRRSTRRDAAATPEWLERVRARIADPAGAADDLDALADLAGCHRTFLSRGFRAWYGVSIGEYRRRCRLQSTWGLLSDDRVSLGAVATRAGFSDQSHMTRMLRREVGETPATIRARLRVPGARGSWFTTHPLSAM